MPAKIIDGKSIALEVREKVRVDVEKRASEGKRIPGLAVILVGQDPASEIYVRKKREACDEAGILSRHYDLDANTKQDELLSLITELIMIQRSTAF